MTTAQAFVALKFLGYVAAASAGLFGCVFVSHLAVMHLRPWAALMVEAPLVLWPAAAPLFAKRFLCYPYDFAVMDLGLPGASAARHWLDMCGKPDPDAALSVAVLLSHLRRYHILSTPKFQEALLPLASHPSSEVRLLILALLAA